MCLSCVIIAVVIGIQNEEKLNLIAISPGQKRFKWKVNKRHEEKKKRMKKLFWKVERITEDVRAIEGRQGR